MTMRGKHVAVTGGTGALGRAVVGALLDNGAVCHLPVFDAAELQGFPHAEAAGVRLYRGIDLSDEAAVEAFYGGLDPLWASIHLAGGFAMGETADTSAAAFRRMMEMNAATCWLCCREAVKAIRRVPGAPGGRIVNVAARPGLEPRQGAGMVPYAMSKAAVAALTQALAEEVAGDGIAVNAIAPSIIDSPANRAAMPDADHAAWPKPAEIAAMVVSLAAQPNPVARGAVVPVYGRV